MSVFKSTEMSSVTTNPKISSNSLFVEANYNEWGFKGNIDHWMPLFHGWYSYVRISNILNLTLGKNGEFDVYTLPEEKNIATIVVGKYHLTLQPLHKRETMILNSINTFNFLIDNGVDTDEALVRACEGGYYDIVKYLVEKKQANISAKDYRAIRSVVHDIPMFRYLFDKGNFKGKDNNSIISAFVMNCPESKEMIECFEYLIENSKNVDLWRVMTMVLQHRVTMMFEHLVTNHGLVDVRVFMHACSNNRIDIVKLIFDKYKERIDDVSHLDEFDKISSDKMRAVYFASQKGYLDLVKLLLENGFKADYNSDLSGQNIQCTASFNPNGLGRNAIYAAACVKHFEIVDLLQKHGANLSEIKEEIFKHYAKQGDLSSIEKLCSNVDLTKFDGLKHATVSKSIDTVKYVLEKYKGLPPDPKIALENSLENPDIFFYLTENVKNLPTDIKDLDDLLYGACNKRTTVEIVKWIVEKGITQNALNRAFAIAPWCKKTEILEYLFGKGIDITHNNYDVLSRAAHYDYSNVISFLFSKKIDFSSQYERIWCIAAQSGSIGVIKVLLQYGVDVRLKDDIVLRAGVKHRRDNIVNYILSEYSHCYPESFYEENILKIFISDREVERYHLYMFELWVKKIQNKEVLNTIVENIIKSSPEATTKSLMMVRLSLIFVPCLIKCGADPKYLQILEHYIKITLN